MSDKIKDAELLKSALAMGSVKLVENPELITIKTISPKTVDQMRWFDASEQYATATSVPTDYAKLETLGLCEKSYVIVVRDESGQLGKIRVLNFLMWLRAHQHMDSDTAQAVVRALPQLFEV